MPSKETNSRVHNHFKKTINQSEIFKSIYDSIKDDNTIPSSETKPCIYISQFTPLVRILIKESCAV